MAEHEIHTVCEEWSWCRSLLWINAGKEKITHELCKINTESAVQLSHWIAKLEIHPCSMPNSFSSYQGLRVFLGCLQFNFAAKFVNSPLVLTSNNHCIIILTNRSPGFLNFQLTNTTTWLWRWLLHRLLKHQSLTTVLLRTPISQMIFFTKGMLLLGSNHFLIYLQCNNST